MEKSMKTFDEIINFSNEAYQFLEKAEGETKLTYALRKLTGDPKTGLKGNLHKVVKAFQAKAEDVRIEHAAEHPETKVLLKDERGNLEYTKEGRRNLIKAINDMNEELIEIEPHFVTDVDLSTLSDYQKEVFKGFVLN